MNKFLISIGVYITGLYLLALILPLQESVVVPIVLIYTTGYIYWIVRNIKFSLNWSAIVLWLFSLAMILPLALMGDHILGVDTHREYWLYVQSDLMNELYTSDVGIMGSCISITALPLMINDVLNIDQELFFKVFYPLLFSIFPLVVYSTARYYLQNKYALISGMLMAIQPLFIWTTANARMSVGMLFIGLIILTMLMDIKHKTLLLCILAIGSIFSYYTTTFILIIILMASIVYNRKSIVPLGITVIGSLTWLNYCGCTSLIRRFICSY